VSDQLPVARKRICVGYWFNYPN
ncbi:uncharacterized protein METZ01_LOCUS244924, partial [marine metagenome]